MLSFRDLITVFPNWVNGSLFLAQLASNELSNFGKLYSSQVRTEDFHRKTRFHYERLNMQFFNSENLCSLFSLRLPQQSQTNWWFMCASCVLKNWLILQIHTEVKYMKIDEKPNGKSFWILRMSTKIKLWKNILGLSSWAESVEKAKT